MSKNELPPGTLVRTNQAYKDKTDRYVEGVIIRAYCELDEFSTIVQWTHQEGNIDPRLNGLKVIMQKRFLEERPQ